MRKKSYKNFFVFFFDRLCMQHISVAMGKINMEKEVDLQHVSLLENILRETKSEKIAAVLALDLMLVGVDTVRKTKIFLELFL